MILIADSGSTKTEWIALDDNGIQTTIFTAGINPFYQTAKEITESLLKEEIGSRLVEVDDIFFYGAGCATEEKCNIVKEGLEGAFRFNIAHIASDLMAAALALCQSESGIACIIGTGSNSCYYDGSSIVHNVSPLGYILGDEGSGAVLGKQLIADILKKQLPAQVIELFFDTYRVTQAELMESIYRQPFPNRYLAQYTRFLKANIHESALEKIVTNGFDSFIRRNLLQYKQIYKLPVHFTGSVAHHFEHQLRERMDAYSLSTGHIEQAPMQRLISYHLQHT